MEMMEVFEHMGKVVYSLSRKVDSIGSYVSGNPKALYTSAASVGIITGLLRDSKNAFWYVVILTTLLYALYSYKYPWKEIFYASTAQVLLGEVFKALVNPHFGKMFMVIGVLYAPATWAVKKIGNLKMTQWSAAHAAMRANQTHK